MSVNKTRPLALIGVAVFSAGLMWATAGQAMEDEGMSHDQNQSMSKESMSHEGSMSKEDNIKAPTGAHGNSADETYQNNLKDDTKSGDSMSHDDSMSSGDSMSHDNMKKKDKM